MYRFLPKKTIGDLNSSQVIMKFVRSYPILVKTCDMLQGKHPSSDLIFYSITILLTHTTKILWIAL